MASTEDFGRRLESIERHLAELDQAVKRSPTQPRTDPMARISPASWLAVTGPVFAALALGFGLLWNGQQATNAHMLELSRTTGRLEGAIGRLDQSIQHLGEQVQRLSERVDRLEG